MYFDQFFFIFVLLHISISCIIYMHFEASFIWNPHKKQAPSIIMECVQIASNNLWEPLCRRGCCYIVVEICTSTVFVGCVLSFFLDFVAFTVHHIEQDVVIICHFMLATSFFFMLEWSQIQFSIAIHFDVWILCALDLILHFVDITCGFDTTFFKYNSI